MKRLCKDYDSTPPVLRKAVTYKDALALHATCGGYLHYVKLLQKRLPEAECKAACARFEEQFMTGCLDAEIFASMENSVPPRGPEIDFALQACRVMLGLCACLIATLQLGHLPCVVRDLLHDSEMKTTLEAEERQAELARKVAAATFEQLEAKIKSDLEILRKRLPTPESRAWQAALDVKYVKDRQL